MREREEIQRACDVLRRWCAEHQDHRKCRAYSRVAFAASALNWAANAAPGDPDTSYGVALFDDMLYDCSGGKLGRRLPHNDPN